MTYKCLSQGMFGSNCFIIWQNNEGIIIDPGNDAGAIMKVVEENALKIKYIVLTHGHIDHICSLEEVREKTGAAVLIHEKDAGKLEDSLANGSLLIFGEQNKFTPADRLLKDGDIIEAGDIKFEVIHTPGHTSGSICIKYGKDIFTGDTLFRMGRGRTDLVDGNEETIIDSIKKRLMTLDSDTVVHPGHNDDTTIGAEKRFY